MDKIIKWCEKKGEEDTPLAHFLKFGLLVGKKSWIHAIISSVSGIAVPIAYDKKQWAISIILSAVMIMDIFYAYVCSTYQKSRYEQRRFSSQILAEQSSLIKSLAIKVEDDKNWKNTIFKTASELVCEMIYRDFKELYNCRTRVSVEYVFNKTENRSGNQKTYVKMSGRRSGNRSEVRKSALLDDRNKYYSYQIFINNNQGINILNEEEIRNSDIWYRNPKHFTDVKTYVGIAVGMNDSKDVKYILQIDCLDDMQFGDNNSAEDIKQFIENNLMSYINTINLSYMLNLTNKKEMMEV